MTSLRRRLRRTEREAALGQSERTPLLVLGGVGLVVTVVAAVVIAVALLVWIFA